MARKNTRTRQYFAPAPVSAIPHPPKSRPPPVKNRPAATINVEASTFIVALAFRWVPLGLLLLAGCADRGELKDFRSDGCSLFPDQSLIGASDWCDCCFEHDVAYWQGGTEAQRLAADEKLRDCVLAKTGDAVLAETMFRGVRFGGSPWFYNWYRWGYGWSYERKYQPLSLEEQRMVSDKLVKYYRENHPDPCD